MARSHPKRGCVQDGQDLNNAAPYINYALFGTPLKAMYDDHLERLREIKKKYVVRMLWDLRVDGNSKCLI